MSQDIPIKKYPVATAEVAKMLGLNSSEAALPLASFGKPADLPVVEISHSGPQAQEPQKHTEHLGNTAQTVQPVWLKAAKAVGPYLAIFFVGLFLYYFFFTGVNFAGLFKSAPNPSTPKETALQSLEKQNLIGYQNWIAGYYYDVSDKKVIDPDNDNSGNGLSNFQKYLLNLNPKSYDTLGLGKPDSQSLAEGINPLTGSPLTEGQKAVLDKYVDLEVAMNRLALSNLQKSAQSSYSGASANFGNTGQVAGSNIYSNSQTNISQPSYTGIRGSAPVTGAAYSPIVDSVVDVNTDIPGRLEIPSLKINVPIMWTKDTNNFDKDLQTGVVHYPGTALPGQIGTSYIAGHSSNYIWAKGSYNRVFSTLGKLADNTSFKVTVVSKSTGKDIILNYVVTRRQEYLPTDQSQFMNTGDSLMALSTCWPINTTAKRLVVFGKLTQVVK